MNDGDWKRSPSSGLVFVLDAAADYPFVNQTTLIEYYLINLSYLTLAGIKKKAKKKNESQKQSEFDLVARIMYSIEILIKKSLPF